MLIQNRSKRTYELKVGIIKPLGVIDVPEDQVEDVLKSGCGELVVLEVAKANEIIYEQLKDKEIVKVIFVKGRIFNIVAK